MFVSKILKAKYHLYANVQKAIYKMLFQRRFICGKRTTFRNNFNIYIEDGNTKLKIGDDCFFNNGCSINVLLNVEIGGECIFGENVKIYDHNHRFTDKTRKIKDQGYTVAPVKIGSHCWVGSNVVILKGVTIGDNCVIGAGCVITEDIPSNSIVTMDRKLLIKSIKSS